MKETARQSSAEPESADRASKPPRYAYPKRRPGPRVSATVTRVDTIMRACFVLATLLIAFVPPRSPEWRLVWSDEFNGSTNVDSKKWSHAVGGDGWGNNERQYYTSGATNAFLDGQGSLVIQITKLDSPQHDCWYGKCLYTSARLTTKTKFRLTYGRIEARLKVPFGQGIWPAFWMLGNDISTVGWPKCGEVDIMENIGREPSIVHGTIHGPGYSGAEGIGAGYTLPNGARFADGYHVFAVEWEPGVIRWYGDGHLYQTRTPDDLPAGSKWVFDHPFFLLLNVAVGGNWPGDPDSTSRYPQTMVVDYVRVFQR